MKANLFVLIAVWFFSSCSSQRGIVKQTNEWEAGRCYVIPHSPNTSAEAQYLCINDAIFESYELQLPHIPNQKIPIKTSNAYLEYRFYEFDCSDSLNYRNHINTKICRIEKAPLYTSLTSNYITEEKTVTFRKLMHDSELIKVDKRHVKGCAKKHLKIEGKDILEPAIGGANCHSYNVIYEIEKQLIRRGYNFEADRIFTDQEIEELKLFQKDNNLEQTGKLDDKLLKLFEIDFSRIPID